MSLRGYLFYLIGGLVVLLTVIQLALVYWIENTVAKEVDVKARQYSKQIVELAVENLNQSQVNQFTLKQLPNDNEQIKIQEQRVLKSPQGQVQIYKIEDHIVTNNDTTQSKKTLKKEFAAIVEKLHSERSPVILKEDQDITTFVLQSPSTKTHWFSQSFTTKQGQSLFQKIQFMLIIVGLFGIGFAFWLSGQFNKPLKQLSNGFEQVANGTFDNPVKVQGVKEIRKTIFLFNQMVKRLNELTEAEKHHKEIAHLAELGEVSRGLAHALRNPLHTIGLSLEQLTDDKLTQDSKQKLLSTVQGKISHLDKSIKALLTLTTNGVSRSDDIPILAVVQDIILEYKASINNKVSFELDVDPALTICGAESEIRSILHTLIYNACEACDDCGHVDIIAKASSKELNIFVIDNGKGLDKNIEKNLFHPHVSSKPDGAGMGLYIAQRLVNLHYKGSIELTNNVPKGCIAKAKFGVNA